MGVWGVFGGRAGGYHVGSGEAGCACVGGRRWEAVYVHVTVLEGGGWGRRGVHALEGGGWGGGTAGSSPPICSKKVIKKEASLL